MRFLRDDRGVALALELALVAIVMGVMGVVAIKVGGSRASNSTASQPSPYVTSQPAAPEPTCTIVEPDGSVTTKPDDGKCSAR
jgi:hypothetical protein